MVNKKRWLSCAAKQTVQEIQFKYYLVLMVLVLFYLVMGVAVLLRPCSASLSHTLTSQLSS